MMRSAPTWRDCGHLLIAYAIVFGLPIALAWLSCPYLSRWIERAALYPDHVHLDLRVALPAQAATPACSPGLPVRVSLGAISVPAQGPVGRWARRTA